MTELVLFTSSMLALQLSGYGRTPGRLNDVPLGLALVLLTWAIAAFRFRLYRRVWAVAGLADAVAIGSAVIEAALLITIVNGVMPDNIRPFRYLVPLLAAPGAAALICLYRLWPRLRALSQRGRNRLLVVAPGEAAFGLIRSIVIHAPSGWEPVGIIMDDPRLTGRTVYGVPVLGTEDELEYWRGVTRADGVAFISDSALGSRWKDLVNRILAAELPVFVLPHPEEILKGPARSGLRELSADDLVGREPRDIDLEVARSLVHGRTVMVTGGAGSIGSELCRLIVGLRPKRLVMLDNNESGLFEISEELRRLGSTVELREALVSITDRELLERVFVEEKPSVVFHAAAYKHVPMLERHGEQAVLANAIGTINVLACADAVGTDQLVFVSTDKAVSRESVMGCTKRFAEMMVLSHGSGTACWAVRFGNVVGSRGSVVPTFERQIRSGGPVTITHPEATRYMMTIREAASLVIFTLSMGRPGHLYMLDMGEPIGIEALARTLIRARGLRPGKDIEITYTGLRPGDALSEQLLAPDEGVRPTSHSSISEVVSPMGVTRAELEWAVQKMRTAVSEGKWDDLVAIVKRVVGVPQPGPRGAPPSRPAAATKPASSRPTPSES